MPNQFKIDIVKQSTTRLKEATGIYFAKYTGMNVVQASFVVEASDQLIMDEMKLRETQFKDLFISYLRKHTMDQLSSMEFQLKSKRELALEINKMLNAGSIDSIYYSGFFIQ